jgi:hypothetical protein
MACVCCGERLMKLYAKASDQCFWDIPHLKYESDGYAPRIPHVCGGDDIDFTFCLDCGHIQNFKPISDAQLKLIFDIEEENYEDPEDDDDDACLVLRQC